MGCFRVLRSSTILLWECRTRAYLHLAQVDDEKFSEAEPKLASFTCKPVSWTATMAFGASTGRIRSKAFRLYLTESGGPDHCVRGLLPYLAA